MKYMRVDNFIATAMVIGMLAGIWLAVYYNPN